MQGRGVQPAPACLLPHPFRAVERPAEQERRGRRSAGPGRREASQPAGSATHDKPRLAGVASAPGSSSDSELSVFREAEKSETRFGGGEAKASPDRKRGREFESSYGPLSGISRRDEAGIRVGAVRHAGSHDVRVLIQVRRRSRGAGLPGRVGGAGWWIARCVPGGGRERHERSRAGTLHKRPYISRRARREWQAASWRWSCRGRQPASEWSPSESTPR